MVIADTPGVRATVFLLAAAFSTPVFGHGGALDGYGCHHNRKVLNCAGVV